MSASDSESSTAPKADLFDMYRNETELEDEEHSSADVDANINGNSDFQPYGNEPLADRRGLGRTLRKGNGARKNTNAAIYAENAKRRTS